MAYFNPRARYLIGWFFGVYFSHNPYRRNSVARSRLWTGEEGKRVSARALFRDEAGSRSGDLEAEPDAPETDALPLRRGFPKRGRRYISQIASNAGRAFAGNELPAKSPLCPERRQAFTQQSKQALRGLARPARPARSPRISRLLRVDKLLRLVSHASARVSGCVH